MPKCQLRKTTVWKSKGKADGLKFKIVNKFHLPNGWEMSSIEAMDMILKDLRLQMENVGFAFEREQMPYMQEKKGVEYKFIHPELYEKLKEDGFKVRGKSITSRHSLKKPGSRFVWSMENQLLWQTPRLSQNPMPLMSLTIHPHG